MVRNGGWDEDAKLFQCCRADGKERELMRISIDKIVSRINSLQLSKVVMDEGFIELLWKPNL